MEQSESDDKQRLAWCVQNGETDEVKKMINKANVNECCKNGRNALHIATDYGHVDIVKYLIEMGVDVNLVDKYEISPLQAAIDEEHTELVELLLKAGAKKDIKTADGRTYQELARTDDIKSLLK